MNDPLIRAALVLAAGVLTVATCAGSVLAPFGIGIVVALLLRKPLARS